MIKFVAAGSIGLSGIPGYLYRQIISLLKNIHKKWRLFFAKSYENHYY
jgi:hypothetical protein